MHGQVGHQSTEDVVLGSGKERWPSIGQDRLGDVQANNGCVIAGDGAKDPAAYKDDVGVEEEECDAPVVVAAGGKWLEERRLSRRKENLQVLICMETEGYEEENGEDDWEDM